MLIFFLFIFLSFRNCYTDDLSHNNIKNGLNLAKKNDERELNLEKILLRFYRNVMPKPTKSESKIDVSKLGKNYANTKSFTNSHKNSRSATNRRFNSLSSLKLKVKQPIKSRSKSKYFSKDKKISKKIYAKSKNFINSKYQSGKTKELVRKIAKLRNPKFTGLKSKYFSKSKKYLKNSAIKPKDAFRKLTKQLLGSKKIFKNQKSFARLNNNLKLAKFEKIKKTKQESKRPRICKRMARGCLPGKPKWDYKHNRLSPVQRQNIESMSILVNLINQRSTELFRTLQGLNGHVIQLQDSYRFLSKTDGTLEAKKKIESDSIKILQKKLKDVNFDIPETKLTFPSLNKELTFSKQVGQNPIFQWIQFNK